MRAKIEKLLSRFQEVEKQLSDPDTVKDQQLYKKLMQEYAYLKQVKAAAEYLYKVENELNKNKDLLIKEKDSGLIDLIKEELEDLEKEKSATEKKLQNLLVPPDPRDSCDILVELRAGTGGEEAALFVANCVKMYRGYAGQKGWKVETISLAESDLGGFKEYIMGISGENVFRLMHYEAGTHRVQRVPETESSGRLHTSAITVAVLLEPNEQDQKQIIDEKELNIDTFRASGAGGQHVNTTDSAVRILHKPSGLVVVCQDERSQHKNKAKALRILAARLTQKKMEEQQKQMSELRSGQIGTGDRSGRIRTYNFPQNRVTDHRIDLTLHNLDQVMQGNLDELTNALVTFYYQQKLSS